MSTQILAKRDRTAGIVLFVFVIALSAPAAFYGVISLSPGSLPLWIDRGIPNIPVVSDIIALVWFVVLFGGRYLLMIAFILNLFLLFRREISFWLRFLASALLVFAIVGILLIESQAGHVRN